jgi:hypothetical protein
MIFTEHVLDTGAVPVGSTTDTLLRRDGIADKARLEKVLQLVYL